MTAPLHLLSAARDAAEESGIPWTLVSAMCEQESAWNPWAMRFEPAWHYWYTAKETNSLPHFGASVATEKIQQGTSFGLMQVIGAVAREHGCTLPFLSALCDPATGLHYGCLHLAGFKRRFGTLLRAVSAYNHGSPQDDDPYAASVLRRWRRICEEAGLPAPEDS